MSDQQESFDAQEGPGHFIMADRCRWHLHHHVNGYCVSSVGELDREGDGVLHPVGSERMYETMVFPLDDEGQTASWSELDADGYNTREQAESGHRHMCEQVATWGPWEAPTDD